MRKIAGLWLIAALAAGCGGGGGGDASVDSSRPMGDSSVDSASPGDSGTVDSGTVDGGAMDGGPRDSAVGDSGGDASTPAGDRYFPADAWMYQAVDTAPLSANSDTVTQWLSDNGGWGLGRLQIDFSIEVLQASADTPNRAFTQTGDFYSPDCDAVDFPVPVGGFLEGEAGYECVSDGDCHLIVVDRRVNRLFEMWRGNIVGGEFYGGCVAAWDMTRTYGAAARGEQCTSADAAGFPIAPLLFTADEVAAGEIAHAIRFILPNARMRAGYYVHPATHAGGPSGPTSAPVYGTRWRLRADYPLDSLPSDAARVVARALQRYGMALADGGNVALTAQSDRLTASKWDGLLGPRDLAAIQPTDFEVIDTGAPIPLTYDCVRTTY